MADKDDTKDAADKVVPTTGARRQWILFAIVMVLSLGADQATKIWARDSLPLQSGHLAHACVIPDDIVTGLCRGESVTVIGGFWDWRLSMNPGSAFGLFASNQEMARIFLSIVGIIAVGGMLWMLRKARPDQRILHWALALVAGGAIGNLIDRIYYGYVTDFILWHVGSYDARTQRWAHEWPVFNVADVVLVVGVGLMFIDIQKEGRREKAKGKARDDKARSAGLVKNLRE
jgi:lipoprotein signal peptidase